MLLTKQPEVSLDKVKLKMLPEEMEVVEEINLVTALMNLWPTEEIWIKEAHTWKHHQLMEVDLDLEEDQMVAQKLSQNLIQWETQEALPNEYEREFYLE